MDALHRPCAGQQETTLCTGLTNKANFAAALVTSDGGHYVEQQHAKTRFSTFKQLWMAGLPNRFGTKAVTWHTVNKLWVTNGLHMLLC